MTPQIRYQVDLFDPNRHLLLVTCSIRFASGQLPEQLSVSLPAWIPGSYMIRDFARQITQIKATCVRGSQTHSLPLKKIDKQSWLVETAATQSKRINANPQAAENRIIDLRISYLVYAWDLSVRGAHFDQTHCFFNGSSVFLRVDEFADQPCTVEIGSSTRQVLNDNQPSSMLDWLIATGMKRKGHKPSARPSRVGDGIEFLAANYDECIDHPFEIGQFKYVRFKAHDVVHHVAITGRTNVDLDRLCADLKPICEAQIAFFEPTTHKAPFDAYWFMTTAVGDGYGGLEHRASTALICNRTDLPYPSAGDVDPAKAIPNVLDSKTHDGYKTFLGLASHEYFHSWNVKRIKPAAFVPYDLTQENYTKLLWIFEGFTSYYDDLFLIRSGRITEANYLRTLAATISGVAKTPGRLRQSVAESSFDAWTKYYKQDENSVNAIVSYYTKGSLVALALDLLIRSQSKHSLDDVMRLMWQNSQRGEFLSEEGFAEIVKDATGLSLEVEIKAWAYGTDDWQWQPLLQSVGLTIKWSSSSSDRVWLGARLGGATTAGIPVLNALGHGPMANAGISAGDVVVAINGLKADDKSLQSLLQRAAPGERVSVHTFRRDELMQFTVTLGRPPALDADLTHSGKKTAAIKQRYQRWLGVAQSAR